jgi:hypothetical protein
MHIHTQINCFYCKEAHESDMGLHYYLIIKLERFGGGELYIKVSAKCISSNYGCRRDISILDKYPNTICSVVFCNKGIICDNYGIERRTFRFN